MRKYDKYMSVFQQINEAPQLILIQFHAIQKGEKNMEGGNLLNKKGEKTKKQQLAYTIVGYSIKKIYLSLEDDFNAHRACQDNK